MCDRSSCALRAVAGLELPSLDRSLALQFNSEVFPCAAAQALCCIDQCYANDDNSRYANPVTRLHRVEHQPEIRKRLAGRFLRLEVVDHLDQCKKSGEQRQAGE